MAIRKQKEIKGLQIEMEELRLSLLKLINLFNKVVGKRHTQNFYSYTLVIKSSKKIKEIFSLRISSKGINYFIINLTSVAKLIL